MTKMPTKLYTGSAVSSTIGYLLTLREQAHTDPDTFPAAERTVMGIPLPPWQRPFVWTADQNRRFIESIWLGLHLGTYVLNKLNWHPEGGPLPFAGMLIDGQQRIRAIEAYLDGEFPVFGAYWHEVDHADQMRFKHTSFPHNEIDVQDETELHELYDRLNFGGTPHEDHQRAVPAGAIGAHAIREAIERTRESMTDKGARWFCRVVDLEAVADELDRTNRED